MKLENQVVSLELAKKLKELGVKQNGLFRWRFTNDFSISKGFEFIQEVETKPVQSYDVPFGVYSYVSAFTVAELGEMLPVKYTSFKGGDDFYWACEFTDENGYKRTSGSSTEADARAKMLIYLLENNLITPTN